MAAVVNPRDVCRILDHLGIHPPRPPNRHDCPPAPGSQGLLPLTPPTAPEQTDPRLDDEWPTDPPFEDD